MVQRLGNAGEAGEREETVAGRTSLSWRVRMPSRAQMEDCPLMRVMAQPVGPMGGLAPVMVR